tara:strand:+ start:2445 stop:2717 length:273 start_codon:yes stop_codon:yes gene_type:complete
MMKETTKHIRQEITVLIKEAQNELDTKFPVTRHHWYAGQYKKTLGRIRSLLKDLQLISDRLDGTAPKWNPDADVSDYSQMEPSEARQVSA